ncbi:MAG: Na/Pi cotransporter family protein [Lachnospiraceae bacterium]|jgi:phosphate:Na+ symporter|nr:Na/Pi cotransporter family protein [Lachnospiraceae bacterium]
MSETFQVISGLLGGLAVFIFGMNMMSEGLQKAAGERMKTILGILTKNPVMGVLAGALVTAVLQSSSATTVMVIGFVSAGLMSLPQAISVILGANIGTTMTAQIIAFKIDDFIWPIVFVGFVIYFFSKKEFAKNVGQTIFAFGLLFVGITTMGNVMKPLASSPVFIEMIARVSDIPVLGVLVGTLMTLVVQSSSATIAVLQNFAMQPGPDGVTSVIGLAGAIPILLGDNIGTTITALLASVGQSKNAKRTAVAHSVFNITGSIVFLMIIPWFARFVQWISPQGSEIDVISRQIANAHTSFNIANTLIWLPLIWLMVKIVMKIVPGKDENENRAGEPIFIDSNMLNRPVFALHLIRKEVVHMAGSVCKVISDTKAAFVERDPEALLRVKAAAQDVESVQEKSVQRLSMLMSEGSLTEEQAKETVAYMYVMNELARIGTSSVDIANVAEMKREKGSKFSKDAVREIEDSLTAIATMVDNCGFALQEGNRESVEYTLDRKREVLSVEARLMKNHMSRLKKGKCSPEFTVAFTTVLHALERMNNNCISAAEMISQEINLEKSIEEAGEQVPVSA